MALNAAASALLMWNRYIQSGKNDDKFVELASLIEGITLCDVDNKDVQAGRRSCHDEYLYVPQSKEEVGSFRIPSFDCEGLMHEFCHWLVATDEQRTRADYGLSTACKQERYAAEVAAFQVQLLLYPPKFCKILQWWKDEGLHSASLHELPKIAAGSADQLITERIELAKWRMKGDVRYKAIKRLLSHPGMAASGICAQTLYFEKQERNRNARKYAKPQEDYIY